MMAVSLDNSQDASCYSFPTRSLNSKTHLSGLAMGCKQNSKSDQVPELNETYLIEGKKQLNNDNSYVGILSNMMEKETHVDSVSSDEQTDICQKLNDIVKDQSEVYRRAEEAISGLSQSNQWRLSKSDGKPGTPLPVIGTVYRNYHHPALIIIFVFPDLRPKILRTSSQGRACPTRTYACLIKHYSKQPIGAPRLNLVPATPKLYKVAFHHVLVFLS